MKDNRDKNKLTRTTVNLVKKQEHKVKRHSVKGCRQAILADTLFSLNCPIQVFVNCIYHLRAFQIKGFVDEFCCCKGEKKKYQNFLLK